MTQQQKRDRARICTKLGITKEQYDEVEHACARFAQRSRRNAIRRLRYRERRGA